MEKLAMLMAVAGLILAVSGTAQAYIIGDVGPAGGRIFYDFGNGWQYLEAAPSDLPGTYYGREIWSNKTLSSSPWYAAVGTSTDIGTGQTNTTAIVNQAGFTKGMAKLADDLVVGGYDDWYLPSKDELTAMRDNLANTQANVLKYGFWGGAPGTSPKHYWSSSEWDATKGQELQFSYEGTLPAGSWAAAAKYSMSPNQYGRAVHTVVPEPATLSLLGLGAVAGLLRRRRRT